LKGIIFLLRLHAPTVTLEYFFSLKKCKVMNIDNLEGM